MIAPDQKDELARLRAELARAQAELAVLRAAHGQGSGVPVQDERNVTAGESGVAAGQEPVQVQPGAGVKVEIELPSELVLALNLEPTQLSRPAREWILLELFHEGLISSGKAAQLLGLSKAGFLQLLDQRGLAYLDVAPEDLERQAAVALAAARAPRPA